MPLPQEFQNLLPKESLATDSWKGPIYWLWIFDPKTSKVYLEHNRGRPRYDAVTHDEIKPDIEDRVEGYIYKIKGGYRITDAEHKPVKDAFIVKKIIQRLAEDYGKPLPNVHGTGTH